MNVSKNKTGLSLFQISQLAKQDSSAAEREILNFVRKTFPKLEIQNVRINCSPISLNSVNGFLETPKREYFFKFHTEEDEEKSLQQNEYYQATELQKAGLPIITPIFQSTQPGSQFLMYEKIEAPTAFEEFEQQDIQFAQEGRYDEQKKSMLLAAEKELLQKQQEIFLSSLRLAPAEEAREASLYQLFLNRFISVNGAVPRVDRFYTNSECELPGKKISFREIEKKKWVINGIEYKEPLAEIIAKAKKLLDPLSEKNIPVVLGHGDDHNGNKFFLDGKFVFFDPAFAGVQPALLSFVKATVHNTFAHPFWLYDPQKLGSDLDIQYALKGEKIIVAHNYAFPDRAPIRQEILDLQREIIWKPLLKEMKERKILPEYWQEYLRKAFFCCPFLVTNLLDPKKYTPQASLLALSKCVELGSKNAQANSVDQFFSALSTTL